MTAVTDRRLDVLRDNFYSWIGLFCFSLPCVFQNVRGQPNPRRGILEDTLTNMVGVQMCVLGVGSNSTSGSSLSVTINSTCNVFINMQWDLSSEVLNLLLGMT